MSVFEGDFLRTMLETHIGIISDDDLLVVVNLELSVHHSHLQLLNPVLVQDAPLDVLEGPSDQVITRSSHN